MKLQASTQMMSLPGFTGRNFDEFSTGVKHMKHSYWYSTTLALILIAGAAHAGNGNPGRSSDRHGPDMQKRMQQLSEDLELSDEQKAQLQTVMQAAAVEREAVREKFEEQIKPELCAIHLNTMAEVREILTAEQAQELEGRMDRWADAEGPGGRSRGKGRGLRDCQQPD